MRKLIVTAVATSLFLIPGTVDALEGASALDAGPNDHCEAFNPGQPQCKFTVSEDAVTPVSGAAGVGTWVVIVKRGKVKTVLKPTSTDPTAIGFAFQTGDKVTAKALTQGTFVISGGS